MSYAAKPYIPMSDRLVDRPGVEGAHIKHLRNMIETLCTRDNRPFPDYLNVYAQGPMADWLKTQYSDADINWADQQVKDFYRTKGQTYRALNGRGRPVGATNKYPRTQSQSPVFSTDNNLNTASATGSATLGDVFREAQAKKAIADSSEYVTKAEFDNHNANNEAQFSSHAKIIHNLAEAGECTSQGLLALNDRVSKIVTHAPTVIEIKRPELPVINIGVQHRNFPKLIKACNSTLTDGRRPNIYLVGPAATGKTYASEQVHRALFNGTYPFRSCGKTIFAHEFMGYYHGDKYVRSQFREAFEHGGIFVADEFDRYEASATVALNNCLAGNSAAFPDGMVKRHSDFIFIACGNTAGKGATMEYNTANRMDAATMNRFITLQWPIDEAVENSLAYNKDWLAIVRKVREGVKQHAIKGVMITTRQVMDGQALISAGFTVEEAEEACLRQGLDDIQWRKVRG